MRGNQSASQRENRLSIRIKPQQKELIVRAAALKNTTVSDFVVEQAVSAATEILADQTHFVLPPEQWEAFCQILDAPPKQNPKLAALFSRRSVFDE
ncbi:MAG: DUF1778 domain-containing protein [Acidobacteria bacterium]|nr:DUF1778 domain-containing protein [Acidobacteriota bacterium]